jgi:serine/threonine protein kinase
MASEDKPAPVRAALVVGIDSYPLHPLKVCVADAIEMTAALTMEEYRFNVSTLYNEQATRKALRKSLEAFFRSQADTYVFYFAGHGWATDLGVYLASVDADADEQGVELDYVTKLIVTLVPVKSTVVLILDCCHAGAATARDFSPLGVDIRSEDLRRAVPALPQGRVVLAACRDDEAAHEDYKIGHGVFTFHLCDGLLGEAADSDGQITVTGLYDYVSRKMQASGRQTPVFRGDMAGRLVFGGGFPPRQQPLLDEELAANIERKAELLLRDFHSRAQSERDDRDLWKAQGYKTACQALEPILGWFREQLEKNPSLEKRPAFMKHNAAALEKLRNLGGLEPGMVTTQGTITRRLGTGTFGSVWLLDGARPGEKSVFKVYHSQDLGVPEKVKRFRQGYLAMKQLDHPFIVKVHQFSECPLGFYMDFIEGANLRAFIGEPLDADNLVSILLTVAETLRHAHGRGVVHRDVKPENIIMGFDVSKERWRPYLSDFDLAWVSTATQFTKEALGTIYYASPEQLAKPASAAARAFTTDVYSFGQLSFFAVTASNPVPLHTEENLRQLRKRLGGGWVAEAAEKFAQLYAECTDPDPEKRPKEFPLLCDRLFEIRQLIRSVSPHRILSRDQFLKELAFSTVGLDSEYDPAGDLISFRTLSAKTRVRVQATELHEGSAKLVYDFHAEQPPLLEGVTRHDKLRKTLLTRVEHALKDFDAQKKYGDEPPFQVFVNHRNVPLNVEGVALSRRIITRIVDAIEGG